MIYHHHEPYTLTIHEPIVTYSYPYEPIWTSLNPFYKSPTARARGTKVLNWARAQRQWYLPARVVENPGAKDAWPWTPKGTETDSNFWFVADSLKCLPSTIEMCPVKRPRFLSWPCKTCPEVNLETALIYGLHQTKPRCCREPPSTEVSWRHPDPLIPSVHRGRLWQQSFSRQHVVVGQY